MITSATSLPEPLAANQPEISNEERRRRWFELSLVLSMSLGTALLSSLYLLKNVPATALEMTAPRSLYGLTHECLSLLLLGYVLSRRNLGLRDLGLHWSIRDIVPSIIVTVLGFFSYVAGASLLQAVHYEIYGVVSRGPKASQFFSNPTIWALPFMLLNPFFEELIVRAYLMTEIKQLTGSTVKAIVFSVFFQASYHLYYGWVGALSVAFQFMVFAIYYSRSKRVVPIIVAHAAFDFYGLFRLM